MRKRKWLLIVVIIIILINLLFWGMTYLFDVNTYIKNRLAKTIGSKLNATLTFSTLNVTSKIFQLSDLEIVQQDGEYTFRAKQLYIHYSFWELLLHKFHFTKALKEIRCFSPEFIYNVKFKEEQRQVRIDIEALEKTLTRFNYISIINGKVSVSSTENIVFSENLEKINISLQKQQDKEWHVKMTAFQTESEGSFEIDGVYSKQSNHFKTMLMDYEVPKISTKDVSLISSSINAEFETTLSGISRGIIRISDIESNFHDESFSSRGMTILLTPDSLKIDENIEIIWKENVLICDGFISNYLSKDSNLDITFEMNDLNLASLGENMSGSIDLHAAMTGNYTSPVIDLKIAGNKLGYDFFEFSNLSSKLTYRDKYTEIQSGIFEVDSNRVEFHGGVSVKGSNLLESTLDITFESDDFIYPTENLTVQSDIKVKVLGFVQNPKVHAALDKLVVLNDIFQLPELSGSISYQNQKAIYDLQNISRSILLMGDFDISRKTPSINAELYANDIKLAEMFKTEIPFVSSLDPQINARLKLDFKDGIMTPDGWFNFGDHNNSSIKGSILISGEVPVDFTGKTGFLSIRSDTLSIHNEPFNFVFNSRLSGDDQIAAELKINDNVFADATVQLDQKDIQYSGSLLIDSLYIDQLNNLIPLFEKNVPLSGVFNADLTWDSSRKISGNGAVYMKEFGFSEALHPFDLKFNIQADSNMISLEDIQIKNSQSLLKGDAHLDLTEGKFELNASEQDVLLEEFFRTIPLKGKASYSLVASGSMSDPHVLCDISIENGTLYKTAFSSFESQLFQDNDMFYLNDLKIIAPEFTFTGIGSYSYNFITEEFHDQPDNMKFRFSGDLLKILKPYIPNMKQASSSTDFVCTFVTDETNTIVDSASLSIKNGQFSIKSQPERIRDFSCNAKIKENVMDLLNGSFRMGDGKLYFKNTINNDESDIFIGDINVGSLKLNNDNKGITIHIPNYQPEKGLVDARLIGYDNEYFTVFNEDGAWVLSGRILLSNGDAIYEQKEKREEIEDTELPPIYADFDLVFDKNIWYVSNPFNLKLDTGNYMSFRSNRETEKLELYFDLHSRRGEMQLFGESFSVADVMVRKSRQDEKVLITATFTKRTPDGSTIYLYVRSTEDKLNADDIGIDAYGDVEVSLRSDNPKDVTMLSILSKLQYGKEISELSEDERFYLGREQAINLASDELNNIIFNPLISPVEGVLRKILGLDYVRLKTGFMKNIIQTSGIVESDDYIVDREYGSDLELIGEISKDILLENLAIDLGKYITPEWYLNYEALIKKEMTSRNETYIGVQHEFSFTWDLPYNFRFIYRYQFYPAQGKENQGISLETVLYF
ncbi:MAG: hypothetical protein P9L89_06040 [Candidatus Celaenobacter polaris]|nr:hypothetical protein [Candidatus Celaenobacter polaris]